AEHVGAAVVAEEQALAVALGQRPGRIDERLEGGRRLQAGVVQQALAVDQELGVDRLGDAVDSALEGVRGQRRRGEVVLGVADHVVEGCEGDRKSTRLNSSHVKISYAVFCLKKKKKKG